MFGSGTGRWITTSTTRSPRNISRAATSSGKEAGRTAPSSATKRGIFADPAKVHPIRHKGRYFETPGVHLCEPSPQRTPILFQAGSSPRGMRFAGKHAECVFVSQSSKAALKKVVASIRAAALEAGREASAIKIFNMQTVIVDETDAKAQTKYNSYRDYVSVEGALALLSGWLGCDFGAYEPDTPLSGVNARSVQSSLDAYAAVEGGGLKTVRPCGMG